MIIAKGPDDDRDRPGKVWVFGRHIEGREVYGWKLKLATVGKEVIAKCLSFHPAEFPLCFPLRSKKGRKRTMKTICPCCEAQREVEVVKKTEKMDIRGELIEVSASHYKCKTCEGEFEDPKEGFDFVEKAYEEYRRRHGMMQPSEIKAFRKKYGLTQAELSKLLGWGSVTLSRYENGALQDDVHDKMMRLAMSPENLIQLIEASPEALPDDKAKNFINQLLMERERSLNFERSYEERFQRYEPDEYSGYKRFDLTKLFNMILYFCREGDFKTKINKLLLCRFSSFQTLCRINNWGQICPRYIRLLFLTSMKPSLPF